MGVYVQPKVLPVLHRLGVGHAGAGASGQVINVYLLCEVAARHAKGRVVSCLAGGYGLGALQASVAAHKGVLQETE